MQTAQAVRQTDPSTASGSPLATRSSSALARAAGFSIGAEAQALSPGLEGQDTRLSAGERAHRHGPPGGRAPRGDAAVKKSLSAPWTLAHGRPGPENGGSPSSSRPDGRSPGEPVVPGPSEGPLEESHESWSSPQAPAAKLERPAAEARGLDLGPCDPSHQRPKLPSTSRPRGQRPGRDLVRPAAQLVKSHEGSFDTAKVQRIAADRRRQVRQMPAALPTADFECAKNCWPAATQRAGTQ